MRHSESLVRRLRRPGSRRLCYGRSKGTFLNELHEAFEKNPDLKPASRGRTWAACYQVLPRAHHPGAVPG